MLRIFGRVSSINVQKVVWCAREAGVTFERIDAGGKFGGLDKPDYLARNPNGKIPMIDDDGFVLWESNAIVRYLAAKHANGSLSPSELAARADADRWMDWQATELGPAMRDAFWQLIRTPEAEREMTKVAASAQASERLLALLDAHLSTRSYVTGTSFTMGDIPLGLQVHRWFGLPLERRPHANLSAWYERLRGRTGAQEVLSLPVA